MENRRKTVCLCLKEGSAEIVEKKSRFLSRLFPVRTEEEAEACLERVRKEHRDARHHCYAYILGANGGTEKCSDDGEPAKTAGMPMLELLKKKSLQDCCVVVTRYFGGVLLGTGGLFRAYKKACVQAIDHAIIAERKEGKRIALGFPYGLYGSIRHMAEEKGIFVLKTEFGEGVEAELLIPNEKFDETVKKLSEMSDGNVKTDACAPCFYCVHEGEISCILSSGVVD